MLVIFLPRSLRRRRAEEFRTPRVSTAIGSKTKRLSMSAYFASFLKAAISAAVPASRAAPFTYDSARGQITVTSQYSDLPFSHGMSERPSGRFPSDQNNPDGSLVTGIPAGAKPRATKSLRAWCLAVRPEAFLQTKLCRRLQRDRATPTVQIPSRLINSRLNSQYLSGYRFDKKSYMSLRLVPISVILNDLERWNGPYFALFHRISVRCCRKTIVWLNSVSKSTFDSLWPY